MALNSEGVFLVKAESWYGPSKKEGLEACLLSNFKIAKFRNVLQCLRQEQPWQIIQIAFMRKQREARKVKKIAKTSPQPIL